MFLFGEVFFSSPSSVIIPVSFLESRVCLSQRMVEAEQHLSLHSEHPRKKWSIQNIKYLSVSKMPWLEGVPKLASYLWVRFEALGSSVWETHTAAAWWRHRDLLSLPEPIWHRPQAPNSLPQHKQVNKPCVFNTSQNFILKGAGEKKIRKEGISLTICTTDYTVFLLVRANSMH